MHRDLSAPRLALRHHDRAPAHAARLRAGRDLPGPRRGRLGQRRCLTYPSSRAPATFRLSAERRWSGSGDFQYGQWRCQPVGACPWDLQGESSSQRRGLRGRCPHDGRRNAPLRQEASLPIQAGTEDRGAAKAAPRLFWAWPFRPCRGQAPDMAATGRSRVIRGTRGGAARRAGRAGGRRCRPRRVFVTTLSPACEHLQLVARDRRLRQPLEHGRLARISPNGMCSVGAAGAERLLQPRPELVPRDDVGPAELERAVRGLRLRRHRPRSRRRRRRPRSAGSAASPARRSGVTGASFAIRRNCCSAPPPRPKTKLGRKITCSRPDGLTSCSISHFAP